MTLGFIMIATLVYKISYCFCRFSSF